MIFYHKSDCKPGLYDPPRFEPAVMRNKAGYYVGYMCESCQVSNRESGYYDSEPEAWSDYNLLLQGLPLTNPREEESKDDALMRRLKAAGLDPQAESDGELAPAKPAKIIVTPHGEVDIELEDPLGSRMHLRLHLTEWGLLGTTSTGFGSTTTDDGFLVIIPDSDHAQHTLEGMLQRMEEIKQVSEQVSQGTQGIDGESMA